MEKKFYVYEHWRPDKDICFYVGKGRGSRANMMIRRNGYHTRIQNKLLNLGMCVEVRLVASGLTEIDAFALEIERISFWRKSGVKLANMSDGGEGSAGHKLNEEQLKRHSEIRKGKKLGPMSEDGRKRIAEAAKGRPSPMVGRKHSEETKAKLAASRIGKPSPVKGKPKTDEQKRKISEALMGHYTGDKNPFFGKSHSYEARKKNSDAHRGKPSPFKGRPRCEWVGEDKK